MKYDIVIIGGGIVGLATALYLKQTNGSLKIIVLEKEKGLAQHQTGNNSGVIHSGLYYKPGSLKATNCINGYQRLLDFCNANDVPYDLCGKIVVATSEHEIPLMENLLQRGTENGLENIKRLDVGELKEYEPHVAGIAGLFVPQTGIVDYKKVVKKYAELFQGLGGEIITGIKVTDIHEESSKSTIVTDKATYQGKLVLNCAGLYSDKVAHMTKEKLNVRIIPFRGEYYKLAKEKEYLVKNLIYPVPDPNFPFLGVHFTRMMRGGVEAGPNAVLAFAKEGYKMSQIDIKELAETLTWPGFQKVAMKYWKTGMGEMYRSFSKAAFTKALQKLMPELKQKDLVGRGAGIRAQACSRDGKLIDDFLIMEGNHSIDVLNAPSPAATSSLSIGESVGKMALERID